MTPQRLFVFPAGHTEPGVTYVMMFGSVGRPVKLAAKAGGQSGFQLDLRHWYTIDEDERVEHGPAWKATTTGYEYRILDSQENEIFAYHWDPRTNRGPKYPHLHVSARADIYHDALATHQLVIDRLHIPTGRILLEHIVRLLVSELGVKPRVTKWPARLRASERVFWEETTQHP